MTTRKSKVKCPRAWAKMYWREGLVSGNNIAIMNLKAEPFIGREAVRIVSESEFRRLRKVEREWNKHVCRTNIVYVNRDEDE